MNRILREAASIPAPANNVNAGTPLPNDSTSNRSEWRQCARQRNAGDMFQDAGTPTCPQKDPRPPQVDLPGTQASRPILVDLDASPTQDGDNSASDELPTRTPDSHGKRVHSQPRLRVVPCSKRMLGVTSTADTEEASAEASPGPTTFRPRYKDPPGYDHVRDFGAAEPHYKPPLLQPKTHGVSRHLPHIHHNKAGCLDVLYFCVVKW